MKHRVIKEKQYCLADEHKWLKEHHTINITGSKFYDWKQMRGGGAIDLVMHVNQCDYSQSVAWLNDRFGESATIEAVTYKTREIIKTERLQEFIPPVCELDKWQRVKQYLTRDFLLQLQTNGVV